MGINDLALLESTTFRPQTTLFEKAAALFQSLTQNYAFINGNKRTYRRCLIMSTTEKIIKEIDALNNSERQKVLAKIKEKYMNKDAILLGENYSWWDNEEDDIYNV